MITDEQLGRIRLMLAELVGRWEAVGPGGSMELAFEAL
jgi:hypothetical protein